MKISKSLLIVLTILWLSVLAFFAFFTETSVVMLTFIYVIGQGFITALMVPYFQQSKKCQPKED